MGKILSVDSKTGWLLKYELLLWVPDSVMALNIQIFNNKYLLTTLDKSFHINRTMTVLFYNVRLKRP